MAETRSEVSKSALAPSALRKRPSGARGPAITKPQTSITKPKKQKEPKEPVVMRTATVTEGAVSLVKAFGGFGNYTPPKPMRASIGKTKSGKAIPGPDHAAYKGKGDHFGGWTRQDHRDASDAHIARSKEAYQADANNAWRQESMHARHQRAAIRHDDMGSAMKKSASLEATMAAALAVEILAKSDLGIQGVNRGTNHPPVKIEGVNRGMNRPKVAKPKKPKFMRVGGRTVPSSVIGKSASSESVQAAALAVEILAKSAHPGFEGASRQVAAKEGVSMERARKIIASGARKASPAAKKHNPRLKRVPGA
jgi:hypothetical protein